MNDALRDRFVCGLCSESTQRFVCGLCSESTQKRLLSEADLTLTKAISIAQSMEAAESESHSLRAEKVPIHKLASEKPNTIPPPKK